MKWPNVELPSSSNNSAKPKRQGYVNNSKKSRVSSNVMRAGLFSHEDADPDKMSKVYVCNVCTSLSESILFSLHTPPLSRRKAEEERIRKEEEKARRELIKQEYLRRKQEALMEEQGLVKPRPRNKSRRNRPKSLHREESSSFSKGSTTRKNPFVNLCVVPLYCLFSGTRSFPLQFHCCCPLSVYICCAGNSLKVSMLIKAQGSAGCREGETSNLLCMM